VSSGFSRQFSKTVRDWWRDHAEERGAAATSLLFVRKLWQFAHESTPERRRQRYGDMEYDWEQRVDTTEGSVRWCDRLLGLFLSPYQPTEPALFQAMMAGLEIEFSQFTFVDLGSGKGRTLLMASEYGFRKIVGVEILPALHKITQENLARYKSESRKCFTVEAVCGDATEFSFPAGPTVLYLFNPLPELGLKRVLARLDASLSAHPRPVYVLYHNPLLEHLIAGNGKLKKMAGTPQYSIYTS
jgi:SAM-dependent methyltransferase